MAPASRARVTGLVLAAGGSTRLGQPKQLLPYGDAPLLEHVLNVARRCPFDQLLCVIGGSGAEVRERVNMHDVEVIENPSYGAGCSSSIAAALGAVDPRSEVLVLMLGDQPGVAPEAVSSLIASRGAAPLAACSYDDGRGHPLAFARSMFAELADLHGDKAVWKLMDGRHEEVVDVPVPGLVPPDIDTWEDYQRAVTGHV